MGVEHQQDDVARRSGPDRRAEINWLVAVALCRPEHESAVSVATYLAIAQHAGIGSAGRAAAAIGVGPQVLFSADAGAARWGPGSGWAWANTWSLVAATRRIFSANALGTLLAAIAQ